MSRVREALRSGRKEWAAVQRGEGEPNLLGVELVCEFARAVRLGEGLVALVDQ